MSEIFFENCNSCCNNNNRRKSHKKCCFADGVEVYIFPECGKFTPPKIDFKPAKKAKDKQPIPAASAQEIQVVSQIMNLIPSEPVPESVDILVGRTLFVDTIYGDDTTGKEERLNKPFKTYSQAIAVAATMSPTVENPLLISFTAGQITGDINLLPHVHIEGKGVSTVIKGRIIMDGTTEGVCQISNLKYIAPDTTSQKNPHSVVTFNKCDITITIDDNSTSPLGFALFAGGLDLVECKFTLRVKSTKFPVVGFAGIPSNDTSVSKLGLYENRYYLEVITDTEVAKAWNSSGLPNNTSLIDSCKNSLVLLKKVGGNPTKNVIIYKNDSKAASMISAEGDRIIANIEGHDSTFSRFILCQSPVFSNGIINASNIRVEASDKFADVVKSEGSDDSAIYLQNISWGNKGLPSTTNHKSTQSSLTSTATGTFVGSFGTRVISEDVAANTTYTIKEHTGTLSVFPSGKGVKIELPSAINWKDRKIMVKNSGNYDIMFGLPDNSGQYLNGTHDSIKLAAQGTSGISCIEVQSDGTDWLVVSSYVL